MKNVSIFFFCTSLSLLSISSFGQKVNFNSQTARQKAGVHIKFSCTLSEISSAPDAVALAKKLKLCEGILKCDAKNFKEDKADLILITNPKDCTETVQNAISKIGFEWVYIDGNKVKTLEIGKYIKDLPKDN